MKIMPRRNQGYNESYTGNQLKLIAAEAQNVLDILDEDYPTVRLLDPEILIFFELVNAMNWLSHSVLGKILRYDYLQSIENFKMKAIEFFKISSMTGHIHSHIICCHLIPVLERHQCGLGMISNSK